MNWEGFLEGGVGSCNPFCTTVSKVAEGRGKRGKNESTHQESVKDDNKDDFSLGGKVRH